MTKIKAGIIGIGGMGRWHLESYQSLPNVDVTAICDIDKGAAEKLANERSIPNVFNDYNRMLSLKDLDAVSVCTPNYLHATISIAALEAGKHVLCEKPVAMNAGEATKVAEKVRETGKTFVIGYWIPHTPEGATLKKLVDTGKLGDLYFVKTGWIRRFLFGDPRWYSVKDKSGGGPLMDLGVHVLDLALWMLNYPDAASVLGTTFTKVAPEQIHETYENKQVIFDVEDMAYAMIQFRGGVTVALEVNWVSFVEKERIYLDLYGTRGGAELYPLRIFADEWKTPVAIVPDPPSNISLTA